jgi:hypothetical protein
MNREELVKAIAERVLTVGDGSKRSAYAELVVDIVQPNHLDLSLFNAFMKTTQMKPGDVLAKRVKRGRYPARTLVPGKNHLADVTDYVEQQVFSYDALVAGTQHPLWEIQSGEIGTVESLRNELRADLFDEIVSRVFTMLATVWNSTDTPDNYVDATGSGVTATALDALIETILERTGSVNAIIGSRRALLPVYTFSQFREFVLTGTGTDRGFGVTDAFNEFTKTNKVNTYKGIPLIELPQVYRNRLPANATGGLRDVSQRMIPTNKIIVVGDNVGEIALMGETQYQDYTKMDTIPPNYVLHTWQPFTLVVDDVELIGVIETNT